jgi:hypothetical protein
MKLYQTTGEKPTNGTSNELALILFPALSYKLTKIISIALDTLNDFSFEVRKREFVEVFQLSEE